MMGIDMRNPLHRLGHSAFTLVELLVVISIIGIMLALLLPAIQAARESARRTECKNQLKQLGLAAHLHADAHKTFPTGGWGYTWAGDPDRGVKSDQPGGWLYNLLPFLEEKNLHDLGRGMAEAPKRDAIRQAIETPVKFFYCPSRRQVTVFPFIDGYNFKNATRPKLIARNDFAACAGSASSGAGSLGPNNPPPPTFRAHTLKGITFSGSETTWRQISDGTSKTMLYGEKYINLGTFESGAAGDDDQGWNVGHDIDITRWTAYGPEMDSLNDPTNAGHRFGSSHSGGFQCVMADGAVLTVSYEVNSTVFKNIGDKADGNSIASDWHQ